MKKKYIVIVASVLVVAVIIACGQIFTVRNIDVVFYNKTGLAGEAEIIYASGLSYKKNIFNIKESEIKDNVAAAFEDNSIVVTNIERDFPNKVVIYVKERVPIFKIGVFSYDDENAYVAPDKDFQRGKIHTDEMPIKLINVTGYTVKESFDVKECVALRELAQALIAGGMREEALPYFIDTIDFSNERMTVLINGSGAKFVIGVDNAFFDTTKLYNKYLSLDNNARNGVELDAKN